MDGPAPTSLPFRVNTPPGGVRSVGAPSAGPTIRMPGSAAETLAAARVDSVELSARPAAAKTSKLVAGSVDVPVSFEAPKSPVASGGAMPMYRHPADRNAAATGVSLGRRVDVTG